MPLEVRHTHAARRDLDSIWNYVAFDNEAAADRQLRRFDEVIRLLAATPQMGRSRSELGPQLRSFPVGRYQIFFVVDDKVLRIVRLIDSARHIVPDMFSD